ncbi:heme exporter protein CcmD [Marinobacter sp. M216]|uniref:Heme exporter protein D n=1 Tax=Marinobacter albus TaxID=3030833 RepID=A0ABT7HAL6_9GAMM|nr:MULTISPECIES: heme exporter protein CcmD [unclassified Marinobacter]MBW7470334.1 heme exporter protein CcmD [Marinobacter sp. F4218]MDK9557401.1 heme exporter protein CcmD [Marinobacter sp. M216]
MAFESLAAFLSMDGHGPYVWTCYGAFFVLMAVMMVWSVRRRRAVIESCRRRYESLESRDVGATTRAAATFTRVNVSQD